MLGRYVEIGAELFAMSVVMGYAGHFIESGKGDREDLVATRSISAKRPVIAWTLFSAKPAATLTPKDIGSRRK